MSIKRFWSNSLGVTMTEMLVALGLLGGISLVTMKVMQNQASNKAQLDWAAAVNRTYLQVQNVLNNSQRCTEMLAGQSRDTNLYPANTTYLTTPLQISAGSGAYQVILAPDTPYAEGFYIPANGIQLAPYGTTTSSVTELILTFKVRNKDLDSNTSAVIKNNTKAGTIVKRLPFIAEFDTSVPPKIKSCGQVISDGDIAAKQQLCLSLAGAATWDAGTKTCLLKEMKCPAGKIPTQMTSLGGIVCTDISAAGFRDQLFDFSSTTCAPGQSVTLGAGAGGKIKATCTGTSGVCPAMTITWTSVVSGTNNSLSSCTASVAQSGYGTAVVLNDSTGPTTGQGFYKCDAGANTWILNPAAGANHCNDDSKLCLPQWVRWSSQTGVTKFCEVFTSGNQPYQYKWTINDSTNDALSNTDGTGSATVQCMNNGKIGIIGNPTCN